MSVDAKSVEAILSSAIISLCKDFWFFNNNLRIQGLIGVTINENEKLIIQIDEIYNSPEKNLATDNMESNVYNSSEEIHSKPLKTCQKRSFNGNKKSNTSNNKIQNIGENKPAEIENSTENDSVKESEFDCSTNQLGTGDFIAESNIKVEKLDIFDAEKSEDLNTEVVNDNCFDTYNTSEFENESFQNLLTKLEQCKFLSDESAKPTSRVYICPHLDCMRIFTHRQGVWHHQRQMHSVMMKCKYLMLNSEDSREKLAFKVVIWLKEIRRINFEIIHPDEKMDFFSFAT